MEKVKNILFITPTLQRTGSEIVLFNLINNLDKSFNANVLSVERGALYTELKGIGKDFLIDQKPSGLIGRLKRRIAFDLILPLKLYFNRNRVWYINTVVIPVFLKYAKKHKVKTIVHTHELEHMWKILDAEAKADLVSVPSLVIANSKFSADVFVKHGYKGPIEISHPSIDTSKYKFDQAKHASIRKKLGIADDNFVWLMCGTIDENKNPELFIKIAERMRTLQPNAKFIWLGDNKNDPSYKATCLNKSKHLDNLTWVHVGGSDYIHYMNCCDGFLLTSQFESFSLVTLEALALGKPVVVNDCLGVSEIIDSPEIGKIIKKNDLADFCETIVLVMEGQLKFNSEKAIQRSKDFDLKIAFRNWSDILRRYI